MGRPDVEVRGDAGFRQHRWTAGLDLRRGIRFGRIGLVRSEFAALRGVVVHIPAGALEMQARRGERTLKQRRGTSGISVSGSAREVLDFFETMATLGAAIGIKRQGTVRLRGKITHAIYCTGRAADQLQTCRPAVIAAQLGAYSMHGKRHRCGVILPCQRELAVVPPRSVIVYFRFSTMAGGLLIVIFTRPRSCVLVVGQAPLAGLLVDDQDPVVGIGDVDEEGVVALGHGQVADLEVSVGVQRGGGVGAGAPDRVVRVLCADQAVLGEDMAFAAL